MSLRPAIGSPISTTYGSGGRPTHVLAPGSGSWARVTMILSASVETCVVMIGPPPHWTLMTDAVK